MVADADEPKAAPFPFTHSEVAALTRGSMRPDRVARMLERHRPSATPAPEVKATKLRPVHLDPDQLELAIAGDMNEELAEAFIEAAKQDRSRKRAIPKGSGKPRLRPPSMRRKR